MLTKRQMLIVLGLAAATPLSLTFLSVCTLLLYITEPWGWFLIFGLFGLGSVVAILWRLPYTRSVPFDSVQREAELEEEFYGDSEAS